MKRDDKGMKVWGLIVVLAVVVSGLVTTASANEKASMPGDANGDGNINSLDITKIELIILGLASPTAGADANGDGNINSLDITKTELIILSIGRAELATNPALPDHDFGVMNESEIDSWTFNIDNSGDGTLSWCINEYEDWLDVSPNNGTTTTETETITVTVNTTGLSEHDYQGKLYINSTGGDLVGVISFSIRRVIQPPSVTTNDATGVEETTARMNGYLDDDGGEACDCYIQWDNDGAPYANENSCGSKTSGQSFYYDASGLTKGDLYYFRAKATNSKGTDYGVEKTFITKPDSPSNLHDTAHTSNSITMGWTKASCGSGTTVYTHVRYSTTGYPSSRSEGTLLYNGTGTSAQATSLSSGQIYYFSAWTWVTEGGKGQWSDTYATDTAYTSPGNPSNLDASNPTSSSIDLLWSKGSGGDKTMIRRKTGGYPSSPSDGVQVYFGTGTSTSDSGLNPETTYYYRAWAYDSDSGYYSDGYSQDYETTKKETKPPSVTTKDATNVGTDSARLKGYLDDMGGADSCEVWFVYDTRSYDSYKKYDYDTPHQTMSSTGSFYYDISDLDMCEEYHFRAVASNSAGTVQGSDKQFTTGGEKPSVTTKDATDVDCDSAQLNGRLDDMGGAEYVWVWFVWDTEYHDDIDDYDYDTSADCMESTGSFDADISGLEPGTTYHFRAVAWNDCGTTKGSDKTFTTPSPKLEVSPDPPSHDFGTVSNDDGKKTWTFTVKNIGECTMDWSISPSYADTQKRTHSHDSPHPNSWLEISPSSGSLDPGESVTVTVTLIPAFLWTGNDFSHDFTVSGAGDEVSGTIKVSIDTWDELNGYQKDKDAIAEYCALYPPHGNDPNGDEDLPYKEEEAEGFNNHLNNYGWSTQIYGNGDVRWTHWAFEGEEKVDENSIAFYGGHGECGELSFSHQDVDIISDCEFGNRNLEWVGFSACSVLCDEKESQIANIMNGVHLLCGYETTHTTPNWIWGPFVGERWSKYMTGDGWFIDPHKVWDAWKHAADDSSASGNIVKALGESEECFDDYIWGIEDEACDDPVVDDTYWWSTHEVP